MNSDLYLVQRTFNSIQSVGYDLEDIRILANWDEVLGYIQGSNVGLVPGLGWTEVEIYTLAEDNWQYLNTIHYEPLED